jgi:phage-related protein
LNWSVLFLNETARAELDALPVDMRAKFERIAMLIGEHGLEKVREPYVKHLEDKLWEMRLIGRDGIARAIYVTASGRRVIVLRTFVKKTEKTPKRELDLARERAKEVVWVRNPFRSKEVSVSGAKIPPTGRPMMCWTKNSPWPPP